jgi:hypothetical protein
VRKRHPQPPLVHGHATHGSPVKGRMKPCRESVTREATDGSPVTRNSNSPASEQGNKVGEHTEDQDARCEARVPAA